MFCIKMVNKNNLLTVLNIISVARMNYARPYCHVCECLYVWLYCLYIVLGPTSPHGPTTALRWHSIFSMLLLLTDQTHHKRYRVTNRPGISYSPVILCDSQTAIHCDWLYMCTENQAFRNQSLYQMTKYIFWTFLFRSIHRTGHDLPSNLI